MAGFSELTYDPLSGEIYKKGKICRKDNSVNGKYGQVTFNYKRYYNHILAWYLYYGEWPSNSIDHINNDTHDNRIENLRCATQKEQMSNTRHAASSTGLRGVTVLPSGSYRVRLSVDNITINIGTFNDLELAELVATEARNLHRGSFANHSVKRGG
ncbi:HNH endonuclease [Akkermansiaceae bacterium]|nr:HNH endonuclease [Akkermansiaceae bacterium]